MLLLDYFSDVSFESALVNNDQVRRLPELKLNKIGITLIIKGLPRRLPVLKLDSTQDIFTRKPNCQNMETIAFNFKSRTFIPLMQRDQR